MKKMTKIMLTLLAALALPKASASTFITVNLGNLTDVNGNIFNSGLVFLVSSGDSVFTTPVIGQSSVIGNETLIKAWEYSANVAETPGFFTNTIDVRYTTDIAVPGPAVSGHKLAAYFFKGLTAADVDLSTGLLTGGKTFGAATGTASDFNWNYFTSTSVENFGSPESVPDASAWQLPADTGATITVSGATAGIGGSSADSALRASNVLSIVPEPSTGALMMIGAVGLVALRRLRKV